MEKHSIYHIDTNGFETVFVGMLHMIQTVPLGKKCRVVLDYDPALPKASIETFIDTSNVEQGQEELKTVHMKEFYACPNCGWDLSSAKEEVKPDKKRTLKQTEKNFNNPNDYIDYRISVHGQESAEKIENLFKNFTEELFKILEHDRITAFR